MRGRTRLMTWAAAIGMVAAGSGRAGADFIEAFQAAGTFSDGASLTGALTIDVTSGAVLASTLAAGSPVSMDFSRFTGQYANYPTTGDTGLYFTPAGQSATYPYLVLVLLVGTLVNYQGGTIGSNSQPSVGGYISGYVPSPTVGINLAVGTLTAVPEPSSLALCGAGALAVAAWARRRTPSTRS